MNLKKIHKLIFDNYSFEFKLWFLFMGSPLFQFHQTLINNCKQSDEIILDSANI